ncbi:MAG: M48 family metallopeptidase [Bacteroidetes bacterium]|nr:M48 family metallopeptidase [Bacteroidota bacterium]
MQSISSRAFISAMMVASGLFAQQNLSENYVPLKSQGTLPEVFTQDIKKVVKQDITDLNKSKDNDKNLKSTYFTEANYEIEKIVKSGNTLINDEVSLYLNRLADVLLKNNPTLRNELHIYALKSSVVNAYSYDKGYIFIDLGLIAQAETEAQLAYILSHEISHYTKKHNIQGYVKNEKIDRDHYSGKSYDDKLLEKCQYSKEFESEADLEGFKLFELSNYNFTQAEKAFDVLQYAHLPFELVEFKKSFLETDYFKIPDAYQLKEVSSIKNNANEDDSKSTHPNTAKRKVAIGELIKNRNNSGRVDYILSEKDFMYVRDLARFEMCRLYLKNRDYPNAFYAAYILEQKYPNNQYLAEVISKCLYAISLYDKGDVRYNKDSHLSDGIVGHSEIESYPQQIYFLINKMPANEWTIMSLNYIYRSHKKFPNSVPLNAMADSMFTLIKNVSWGISDFVRTDQKKAAETVVKKDTVVKEIKSKTDMIANIQQERINNNHDTAYYKDIYLDLFMNDKEFVSKFPAASNVEFTPSSGSGFGDYKPSRNNDYVKTEVKRKKKGKKGDNIENNVKIEKVILLEPFYIQIDRAADKIDNLSSDQKQEKLIETVKTIAEKENFQTVALDPGLLTSGDVDKVNDYSVLNDWFFEKFDGDRNSDGVPIFNTDQVENLVKKYGTSYVLKIGIISLKGGRKRTWFYSGIIDLKTNKEVFKLYEVFREKDTRDLINSKIYQTFFELKHGK